MTAPAHPGIDTSDIQAVHGALRSALASVGELVGSVADGDVSRAGVVGSYYDNVLRFLNVHHLGEDELLWPRLLERAPGSVEIIEMVAGQHDTIHQMLLACLQLVARWQESASAADGVALVDALVALGAELNPHLDQEEELVVPLAAAHFTQEEWGEFPGHALRSFDGDKVWLILGLIRDKMTDQQRDDMLANMPPPVSGMWRNLGADAYAAFMDQVRG